MKEMISWLVAIGMWVLNHEQVELIWSVVRKGVYMQACFVQCMV